MQISGAEHWFLEGWIGDHSVEFLVDSGSSVTAMSDSFYQTLVHAGAPLGALQYTARTLRSANGTGIEVSGCSRCVVSFMGLHTEFPIIICNLAMRTDAIIGTDVLGSVLPHTLDKKKWFIVCKRWCFTPTAPAGFSSFWACFHGVTFLNTTIFGGCAALLGSNYRRSDAPVKWPAGRADAVCRKYGPHRG